MTELTQKNASQSCCPLPRAKRGGSVGSGKPSESSSVVESGNKSNNIQVVARIRPLLSHEVEKGCTESVFAGEEDATDDKTLESYHENGETKKIAPRIARSVVVGTGGKKFDYDRVLDSKATQEDVYNQAVGDSVSRNTFLGYNTTILAYGTTGSGKSYTMGTVADTDDAATPAPTTVSKGERKKGAGSTPRKRASMGSSARKAKHERKALRQGDGIIARAIHDLYSAKDAFDGMVEITLTCMEVYNDEIRDLLKEKDESESVDLQIKDGGQSGVRVQGVSAVEVNSPFEAITTMDEALMRRSVGSTNMNSESSRSHSVCVLHVTIMPTKEGTRCSGREIKTAKLTLVDLAGSERLKQTGAEGVQQKEGISINKDLFVLGKVVSSLAEKSRRKADLHVPYRDSKLTRILRDSLGGNCCTIFIACVSPNSLYVEESINTLRYAQRARTITNTAVQNIVKSKAEQPRRNSLLIENERLKAQLEDLLNNSDPLSPTKEEANFSEAERRCIMLETTVAELKKKLEESNMRAKKVHEEANKAKGEVDILKRRQSETKDLESFNNEQKQVLNGEETSVAPKPPRPERQRDGVESNGHRDGHADDDSLFSPLLSFDDIDAKYYDNRDDSNKRDIPGEVSIEQPQVQSQLAILQSKLEETQEKLADAEAKAAEETLVREVLETKLAERRKELEHEIVEMLSERDLIEDHIEALKVQLELTRSEHYKVNLQCVEGERRLNELHFTIVELDNEIAQRNAKNEKIYCEELRLKEQVHALATERDVLIGEVEEYQGIMDLSSQLSAEEERRNHAQHEADELKGALETVLNDNADVRLKLDELERFHASQLEEERATRKAAEEEASKLRKQLARQKKKLKSSVPALSKPMQSRPADNSPVKEPSAEDSSVLCSLRRSIPIPGQLPPRPPTCDQSANSGEATKSRGSKCSKSNKAASFEDDASSESSQRQIRIDAAKMLFKATKSIERGAPPSPGKDAKSPETAKRRSLGSSPLRGKSPNAGQGKRKARMSESSMKSLSIQSLGEQSCSMSVVTQSQDPKQVEFFLPKLDFSCQCENCKNSLKKICDPKALSNILREWQVDFLLSAGITKLEELTEARKTRSRELCKAMKKWRAERKMKDHSRKSCQIALHIWARTARIILRSINAQGTELNLSALREISLHADDGSVSTLGCSILGDDEQEV